MSKKKSKKRIRQQQNIPAATEVAGEGKKASGNVWLALLVTACAGLLAYSNSFGGPFIFDDVRSVMENPSIRSLSPIWETFRPPGNLSVSGRPLVNFTFALNYALSGQNVWSYHALNLLIHILGAVTLLGIVRRILLSEKIRERFGSVSVPLAFGSALLWVLHPLQTGAATYITQRCESLMGLFFLLTVYTAIRGWQSTGQRAYWHTAAAGFCVLGTGAKEVIATAPLVVFACDWFFFHPTEGAWKILRRSCWLYGGLLAALIPLVLLVSAGGTSASTESTLSSGAYALTQAGVILHYIGLTVWPTTLCLDYAWPETGWEAIPYVAIVLTALTLTVWACWKRRAWGFAAFCFFITLAPTSSILPLPAPAVEHRMYLALAGLSVLLVVCGYEVALWIAQRFQFTKDSCLHTGGVLLAVAAIILGTLTFQRNVNFQSELSIWSDTVRKQPGNPRAHNNLGNALLKRNKTQEAISHYQQALRIKPGYASAHFNLGKALSERGELQAAISHYRATLQSEPDYAEAHYNLGNALLDRDKPQEALSHYQETVRLDPNNTGAHKNLGTALNRLGKPQEAIRYYQEALRLNPNDAEAHNNLGATLAKMGKPQEAIAHFRKALKIDPNNGDAQKNLEHILQK